MDARSLPDHDQTRKPKLLDQVQAKIRYKHLGAHTGGGRLWWLSRVTKNTRWVAMQRHSSLGSLLGSL